MKTILLLFLMMFLSSPVWATTWYVRDGGGTASQCTGHTNAVYPGSGSNQPCAVSHPAWIFGTPNTNGEYGQPPLGTSGLISSGDTVYIDGDSDVTPGTQAQYMIGYGMPNTSNSQCQIAYGTGACVMAVVPAGINSSQLTQVIGCSGFTGNTCNASPTTGHFQPQLWGTQNLGWILDLTNGGNYDIENLEITQHSSCSYVAWGSSYNGYPANCPTSYPYGTFAQTAIYMQGANITTKNLWVHNISRQSFFFPGQVSNWNSTNDKVEAAGQFLTNGTDGSQPGDAYNMSFAGNNSMTNDIWAWGGCMEKYPLPNPGNVKDVTNYINCCDNNLCGGSALGGGFAMQSNQSTCGNWTLTNTQLLFNMKSNWDFLHCDGTGTFNFYRSRSEGPTGEALKINMATVNIEDSQLLGNDDVWTTAPFQPILSAPGVGAGGSVTVCRGQAGVLIGTQPNGQFNIINSDLTSNCGGILITSNGGQACAGMTVNSYNSKYIAGNNYLTPGQTVDLRYDSGDQNPEGNCGGGNGCGLCGTGAVIYHFNHDSVYNEWDPSDCTGTGMLCGTDPLIIGEQGSSISNLLGPNADYSGTSLGDQFYLQSSSPLKGAALASGVPYTSSSSNDYNNHPQNSPPDIGAIQYNSCIASSTGPTNGFCSISNQCCGGTCNSEQMCVGGGGGGGGSIACTISGISQISGSSNF